jgi:hypothetical protein
VCPLGELFLHSYRFRYTQSFDPLLPQIFTLPDAQSGSEDEASKLARLLLCPPVGCMTPWALTIHLLVLWHAASETVCKCFEQEQLLECMEASRRAAQ